MIIDTFNEMSDAQAVTATAASTDVIDLNAAGDALSKPIWVHIKCVGTTASGGATTLDVALQTSDAEAFGSYDTLWSVSGIAKATLVAGYQIARFALPAGCKRYLRLYYTVNTADFTSGNFDAFLSNDADTNEF